MNASTSAAIRLARPEDIAPMQAIYAPCVEHAVISFETEVPSVEEFGRRVQVILERYPWLVYRLDERVAGYAYASQHRPRAAYQWSVETTVYVAESARRRGVARALYTALAAVLRLQGIHQAWAGIVLPNPASVTLHERMGFTPVGVYPKVGFKHGAWHDVGWWGWRLGPDDPSAPTPPRPLPEIVGTPDFEAALRE